MEAWRVETEGVGMDGVESCPRDTVMFHYCCDVFDGSLPFRSAVLRSMTSSRPCRMVVSPNPLLSGASVHAAVCSPRR